MSLIVPKSPIIRRGLVAPGLGAYRGIDQFSQVMRDFDIRTARQIRSGNRGAELGTADECGWPTVATPKHYRAVAEVLAYIYRIMGTRITG